MCEQFVHSHYMKLETAWNEPMTTTPVHDTSKDRFRFVLWFWHYINVLRSSENHLRFNQLVSCHSFRSCWLLLLFVITHLGEDGISILVASAAFHACRKLTMSPIDHFLYNFMLPWWPCSSTTPKAKHNIIRLMARHDPYQPHCRVVPVDQTYWYQWPSSTLVDDSVVYRWWWKYTFWYASLESAS